MDPNKENNDPIPETDAEIAEGMVESMAGETEVAVEPPKAEGEQEGEPAKATEGEPEGEGDPAAKAGEPAADPKAAKPDKPKDEPAKDEAVEQEIADLKLSDKSAERFRALTGQVKELAPIRDAMEKAGVKDIADLPKLVERAKLAEDFAGEVQATGASPEQYGQALDYLGLVTRAAHGDMKAAEQAFAVMEKEYQALGQLLGKDVGTTLPDDLQAEVEAGDLTRQRALEIAAGRTREAASGQRREQQSQQEKVQQATQQGNTALDGWDKQMAATDATYASKRATLSKMVGWIKANLPPDKWVDATQKAYATIPAPAPAPAPPPPKVPVGAVPLRGTGLRQPMEKAEFDDPDEAMWAGIQSATG